MIAKTQKGEIVRVVRDMLAEGDDGAVAFDPILVATHRDQDGDECLEITIIYEGHLALSDARREVSLILRLEEELEQRGIDGFDYLGRRFVEKSEWEAIQEQRYFAEEPLP